MKKIKDPETIGDRKEQGQVIQGIGHHHVRIGKERLAAKEIGVPKGKMA